MQETNNTPQNLPLQQTAVMGSVNHYIVGCDPYDRLNWLQTLLKKTGLFYRNRPKSSVGIFKWKEDGSVEFVKHCP